MDAKKLIMVGVCCAIGCLLLGLMAGKVEAQAKTSAGSAERDMSTKKGMQALEGGKKLDEKKKPGILQMVMGFGSIFVMIAVLKWL